MKGKVFIAWSGIPDIANNVKIALAKHDYSAIVGGERKAEKSLFLGPDIINDIDCCDQAMFIIEKKGDAISSNLLFELGYSLSKFKTNKIHIYCIDMIPNNQEFPSDIKGVWAEEVRGETIDIKVDKIIEHFIAKQKVFISDEKMDIVNSFNELRNRVNNYTEHRFCSEFEFAQKMLFYAQSAYNFKKEKAVIQELQELLNKLNHPSRELEKAINFSIDYLKIFNKIKQKENIIYIEYGDYRDLIESFTTKVSEIEKWPENDFTLWFLAFLYDSLNYLSILYSNNPEHTSERKAKRLKNTEAYAQKCLSACDKLDTSSLNKYMVCLLRAYMFRNLSIIYKSENQDMYLDYLKKSLAERKELREYYRNQSIQPKLHDTFEMEYFLVLSEVLPFIEDEDMQEDYTRDCKDYVDKMKRFYREKNYFINKIEIFVNRTN